MVEGSLSIDGLRTKIEAEWQAGVYQAEPLLPYRPGGGNLSNGDSP